MNYVILLIITYQLELKVIFYKLIQIDWNVKKN